MRWLRYDDRPEDEKPSKSDGIALGRLIAGEKPDANSLKRGELSL
jgi:hypothetical protein